MGAGGAFCAREHHESGWGGAFCGSIIRCAENDPSLLLSAVSSAPCSRPSIFAEPMSYEVDHVKTSDEVHAPPEHVRAGAHISSMEEYHALHKEVRGAGGSRWAAVAAAAAR